MCGRRRPRASDRSRTTGAGCGLSDSRSDRQTSVVSDSLSVRLARRITLRRFFLTHQFTELRAGPNWRPRGEAAKGNRIPEVLSNRRKKGGEYEESKASRSGVADAEVPAAATRASSWESVKGISMDGPLAVSLDDLPAPYEALTSLKRSTNRARSESSRVPSSSAMARDSASPGTSPMMRSSTRPCPR